MSKVLYLGINNILAYEDDKIEIQDIKKSNEFIGSVVKFNDLITYSFKLPKSYSEQELKIESEIKFYEEANLDMSKKYYVIYINRELSQEENILIEAVAVEEENIRRVFKDRIEKVKYIDYLAPQFFVFKEFYPVTKTEPKRDAFVYLDKETSFVTIYENGEYLYSKSLNSLNILLKSLKLSYDEFIELAKEKGLDKESYKEEESEQAIFIDKFFSEFFMKINNILMYGRSVFYLDGIDRIYFYSPFEIKNIDTFKDFWNLSGVEFNKLVVNEELKVNQVDLLALYYIKNLEDKNQYNFNIFERPPPIYKTEVGKLSIFMVLVLCLFGGDYYYRTTIINPLKRDVSKLQAVLNEREEKSNTERAKLNFLQTKYDSALKKENEMNDKIKFFSETIKLTNKIIEEPKVSDEFVLLSKLLKNNSLKVFSIDKNSTKFLIQVYATKQDRKNIGEFMNDALNSGFGFVSTKDILLKDNKYISKIGLSK